MYMVKQEATVGKYPPIASYAGWGEGSITVLPLYTQTHYSFSASWHNDCCNKNPTTCLWSACCYYRAYKFSVAICQFSGAIVTIDPEAITKDYLYIVCPSHVII